MVICKVRHCLNRLLKEKENCGKHASINDRITGKKRNSDNFMRQELPPNNNSLERNGILFN